MQVDPTIFKAYDIRGIYPDQLNEDVARAIGRAFVTHLQPAEVVVGRDMRLSSPTLFEAVVSGLTQQGADVVDIGMVGTDQYYFAAATLERPGVMVTASTIHRSTTASRWCAACHTCSAAVRAYRTCAFS